MIAFKTLDCIHEIMAMLFTQPACLVNFRGFFLFYILRKPTCLKDVMR